MTAPWPEGARAACAFTVDLDAETLWIARGVTEPVAISQGTPKLWLARLEQIAAHTRAEAA